ncbi:hypothetical protein KIL84_005636 [Mauremys mutica]|uniref:Uncharacterized protein n=1 Tax=Mauremys mutica TaxID=74926 RepID=A0A9D3XH89_9SAUR|nr:hypothetical protein KIL84_005636 [Mauremys mutica]
MLDFKFPPGRLILACPGTVAPALRFHSAHELFISLHPSAPGHQPGAWTRFLIALRLYLLRLAPQQSWNPSGDGPRAPSEGAGSGLTVILRSDEPPSASCRGKRAEQPGATCDSWVCLQGSRSSWPVDPDRTGPWL